MKLRQFGLHLLETEAERGAPGSVQPIKLFGLRLIDDGEEIATHAATHRLHEAERGVGSDGRIDRVAAGFQRINPDLRGQRMARADHAVLPENFRARGERFAGDAVRLRVQLRVDHHGQEENSKRTKLHEAS